MAIDTVSHRLKPAVITGQVATGTTQATALQLANNSLNEIVTTASGAGVVLPYPVIPSEVTVVNQGANALAIYPAIGDSLLGGTVNSPISLASGSAVTYWASSGGNWYVLQTAAAGGTGSPGGTSGQIQYDNGGSFGGFTASGDATVNTTTGAVTIAANAVTYAKMQAVTAARLLGNPSGGSGVPSEVILGTNLSFTGSTLNAAGGSGGGTPGGTSGQIQYDASGSFGGFTMSGDATLVASTGVITVAANAVTYAKFQHVAASSLLGNPTGSPANASEITLGANLSFSGTTLVASGSGGSSNASLARWALAVGATLATGTNLTSVYTILQASGSFNRVDLATTAAITGQAVILDILKSSNQGTTWTSLWATHTGNRPSIAVAAVTGTVLSANFDTTTYSAGDWLRIDCIQVGTGSQPGTNISVALI